MEAARRFVMATAQGQFPTETIYRRRHRTDVERYRGRQPDLVWQPELAREIVTDWRRAHRSDHGPRQTIAPLHNLSSLLPLVRIGSDTVIRPMTNEDREEMWRAAGPGAHAGVDQRDRRPVGDAAEATAARRSFT
jgi:hypothetical protein